MAGERFAEYRLDDQSSMMSSGKRNTPSMRIPPASPTKSPQPVAVNKDLNQWKRLGASKTGTCLRLGIDRANDAVHDPVPNIILTWRGDEPLDRLHLCVKVSNVSLL